MDKWDVHHDHHKAIHKAVKGIAIMTSQGGLITDTTEVAI